MRRMVVVSVIAALCLVGITYGVTRALDARPTDTQVQDRQDKALIASCVRGNIVRERLNILIVVQRDYLLIAAARASRSPVSGGEFTSDRYLALRQQLVPIPTPDCARSVLHPTKLC